MSITFCALTFSRYRSNVHVASGLKDVLCCALDCILVQGNLLGVGYEKCMPLELHAQTGRVYSILEDENWELEDVETLLIQKEASSLDKEWMKQFGTPIFNQVEQNARGEFSRA